MTTPTPTPKPTPTATPFDLEKVYDEEIAPLMQQIITICNRHRMPMLATFVYAKGRDTNDPEGLDLCTTALPRLGWQAPELAEALRVIRNGASSRPRFLALTIKS